MAQARQQATQQPEFSIRVDDISDIIGSLQMIEQEANGLGTLKSAVIEFEDYEASYSDREWVLRPRKGGA